MTMLITVYFGIFLTMQVSGSLLFCIGGKNRALELPLFVIGNVIAAASLFFLMRIYRTVNVNVAYGIGTGGAVLLSQIAIAIVFKSKLTPIQYCGGAAMVAGILLLSLGSQK